MDVSFIVRVMEGPHLPPKAKKKKLGQDRVNEIIYFEDMLIGCIFWLTSRWAYNRGGL